MSRLTTLPKYYSLVEQDLDRGDIELWGNGARESYRLSQFAGKRERYQIPDIWDTASAYPSFVQLLTDLLLISTKLCDYVRPAFTSREASCSLTTATRD